MSEQNPTTQEHFWVKNTAFTRLTGFTKVCIRCRLALVKGERLTAAERNCPGRVP